MSIAPFAQARQSPSPLLQPVAFLTCHDKAPLVRPALAEVGFAVTSISTYDTDRFGTFSREIPRTGSAHETALSKAKLAASLGDVRYGLGSEGSFGRDPHLGWMPWDYEILCLWDAQLQYAVFAMAGSGATNYAHGEFADLDAALSFMEKARFPEHALILGRPAEPWFCKGIRDQDWLIDRLESLLASEPRIWLETDMRAHLNPARQVVIGEAARVLAQRLASLCPHCRARGFAVARSEPGLLCADCGLSTPLAAAHIWECPSCQYNERRPVTLKANAFECEHCNP